MIRHLTPSVFVVESNEETRRQLCGVLSAMQFDVHDFSSAESFLAQGERCVRGCVVAGLRLGGMSGLELQGRLHQQGDLLPVILVAARVSTQLIVRAMRGGAVAFLDVPVNEDELWLAVREALAENAERMEHEERRMHLRARFGQLTEGEILVLTKVCEGLTNKEIASHLDVSIRTVEARRRRLLKKTCTHSFPELLLTYEQFKTTCQDANHTVHPQPRFAADSMAPSEHGSCAPAARSPSTDRRPRICAFMPRSSQKCGRHRAVTDR